MKTYTCILVSFLLSLSISLQAQNWWKNGITGEGEVITMELDIDHFEGVSLGFAGDIVLTQGSPRKVVVEGQKNVIENIQTTVKSGVWHVNYEKGVRKAKPVTVYITMPTLEKAGVSGSGNLSSTNTFHDLDDVEVYVSGSGNVKLMLEGKAVRSQISGSGEIHLEGQANSNVITISGSGDVEAADLRVASCEVTISGSGDADVHATEDLQVRISGSGDVRYKGDPRKVRSSVSGSGDVNPM